MAPDQDLDLLSSLLTSLRNTKATFGEGSAQYREMKAWVDEHISAAAAATAPEQAKEESNAPAAAGNASQHGEGSSDQPLPQQQQHVFNLAFRPRAQGAGYAQ